MLRQSLLIRCILILNVRLMDASAVLVTEATVRKASITCAQTTTRIAEESDNLGSDQSSTELPLIKCETNYCYAFWQQDPSNGSHINIMGQGCWESSGKPQDCERSACVSDKKPPKAMNNTKFCCCAGDLCNANFVDAYVPGGSSEDEDGRWSSGGNTINRNNNHNNNNNNNNNGETSQFSIPVKLIPEPLLFLVLLPISVILVALVAVSSMIWYAKQKSNKNDMEMGAPGGVEPPDHQYALDKLKLVDIIGQGRYGSVWRGLVDQDQEVAVKVFPPHHRQYFFNEHELYKVAGECVAVVKCFGGGERLQSPASGGGGGGGGGGNDYMLILNLERGSLQDYLKENALDLAMLCKMSLSIARGLAYLHSDIEKPCIAHRDINTRNILVRADLTCCICDLGLAILPRRSDNHTLSEAGTLRYMAPEVLEGAVNLRDCESALKQIDVYALGLVLWELGSRCIDMQTAEVPPYYLPFYAEIGDNPSLEQMQTLVSKRKARPLWPLTWKDTAAARLFCETAEDCWDQDAEARLTSLCVEERLAELPTMRGRVLHPMHPVPISPTATVVPLFNNNHLRDDDDDDDDDDNDAIDSSSTVGTVETLLSPSEEHCKNSNQLVEYCQINRHRLQQPYHGRNPCMERNLLSGSSDCLLVERSSKHQASGGGSTLTTTTTTTTTNTIASDSEGLIANDFLNYQLRQQQHSGNNGGGAGALPIPYLQNAVRGSPKRYNCSSVIATYRPKAKFSWSNLKRFFTSKNENRNTKVEILRDTTNSKRVNDLEETTRTTTTTLMLPSFHDAVATKERRPTVLPLAQSQAGVVQLLKTKDNLTRQHSIEQFTQVFASTSDLSQLKDPSLRVKTPGDVPPSVRKTRGRAVTEGARYNYTRFSLYDDRMMWSRSADLERSDANLQHQRQHSVKGSVSSF